MNRREFSDYYGIPYRTVQDWEAEKRELPDYLLRLLKYRAEIECRIERAGKQNNLTNDLTFYYQLRCNALFFVSDITQCVYLNKAEGGKRGKKSKCNRGYGWKEDGIYS